MFRSTFQHVLQHETEALIPVYALARFCRINGLRGPTAAFIFHNSSAGIFKEKFGRARIPPLTSLLWALPGNACFQWRKSKDFILLMTPVTSFIIYPGVPLLTLFNVKKCTAVFTVIASNIAKVFNAICPSSQVAGARI